MYKEKANILMKFEEGTHFILIWPLPRNTWSTGAAQCSPWPWLPQGRQPHHQPDTLLLYRRCQASPAGNLKPEHRLSEVRQVKFVWSYSIWLIHVLLFTKTVKEWHELVHIFVLSSINWINVFFSNLGEIQVTCFVTFNAAQGWPKHSLLWLTNPCSYKKID